MANGREGKEGGIGDGTWGCMTNDMPEKSIWEKNHFSNPQNIIGTSFNFWAFSATRFKI